MPPLQQFTPGNTDVMVRCCHCGSSICDQPNFCDDTSMATYLPLIPLRETASTEETEESESPMTMVSIRGDNQQNNADMFMIISTQQCTQGAQCMCVCVGGGGGGPM